MRGYFDRTPVSPTTGNSTGMVAYKTTGRRPRRAACDAIDECPTCPVDQAFKYPVVVGDLVYFQFNLADHYNDIPSDPEFGWYNDPSGEYWVRATLEFSNSDDLVLPSGEIVRSANVGYYDGSYQNLILNSTHIYEYVLAQGFSMDCFRVKVEAFRWVLNEFTQVVWEADVLPGSVFPYWEDGDLLAIGGEFYEVDGTGFTLVRNAVDNEWIFNQAAGSYYQWDEAGEEWEKKTIPLQLEVSETCYSTWHKFELCPATVLINGVFGLTDCNGKYYGISEEDSLAGLLPYRDLYRLNASLEMQRIFAERETNENEVVISFKEYEEWLFRNSQALPDQIVRRLANTFIAPHFFLDSNEYINPSDVSKINAEGLYWYVAPTVQRLLCEKENECDPELIWNPIVVCPTPDALTCDDVTIENSDETYVETATCGSTFVLEDTTYNIYVDGVLAATEVQPSMIYLTLNILW